MRRVVSAIIAFVVLTACTKSYVPAPEFHEVKTEAPPWGVLHDQSEPGSTLCVLEESRRGGRVYVIDSVHPTSRMLPGYSCELELLEGQSTHISLPAHLADQIDRQSVAEAGFRSVDYVTLEAKPNPGEVLQLHLESAPPHGGPVTYTFKAVPAPWYRVEVQHGNYGWRTPAEGELLPPGPGSILVIFPREVPRETLQEWVATMENVVRSQSLMYTGLEHTLEISFSQFPSQVQFPPVQAVNGVIMHPDVNQIYFADPARLILFDPLRASTEEIFRFSHTPNWLIGPFGEVVQQSTASPILRVAQTPGARFEEDRNRVPFAGRTKVEYEAGIPSPDYSQTVSAEGYSNNQDGTVHAVPLIITKGTTRTRGPDVLTLHEWGCGRRGAPDLLWHPGGDQFAVVEVLLHNQIGVSIVDVAGEKKLLHSWSGEPAQALDVRLAFSPDGRYLVASPYLIDLRAGQVLKSDLTGSEFYFSPDGQWLAMVLQPAGENRYGPLQVLHVVGVDSVALPNGRVVGWTPTGELAFVAWENPMRQAEPLGPCGAEFMITMLTVTPDGTIVPIRPRLNVNVIDHTGTGAKP